METPEVSFKQVVSRGCGLDVHKKVVVAYARMPNGTANFVWTTPTFNAENK